MYLWGRLPLGLTDDKEFCRQLVTDTGEQLRQGGWPLWMGA